MPAAPLKYKRTGRNIHTHTHTHNNTYRIMRSLRGNWKTFGKPKALNSFLLMFNVSTVRDVYEVCYLNISFNHLKMKLRLINLKTQFVSRSKHFSSRL